MIIALLLISFNGLLAQQHNPCAGKWWGEIVAQTYSCNKYYACILTIANERSCAEDNVFDNITRVCVPGNPVTCEIFELTKADPITDIFEETTPGLPPPNLNEICRGVFFAAKPYPESSIHFIGCIRGVGLLFKCYEDEFFHPEMNECSNWEEIKPTASPTDSPTEAPTELPTEAPTEQTTEAPTASTY